MGYSYIESEINKVEMSEKPENKRKNACKFGGGWYTGRIYSS